MAWFFKKKDKEVKLPPKKETPIVSKAEEVKKAAQEKNTKDTFVGYVANEEKIPVSEVQTSEVSKAVLEMTKNTTVFSHHANSTEDLVEKIRANVVAETIEVEEPSDSSVAVKEEAKPSEEETAHVKDMLDLRNELEKDLKEVKASSKEEPLVLANFEVLVPAKHNRTIIKILSNVDENSRSNRRLLSDVLYGVETTFVRKTFEEAKLKGLAIILVADISNTKMIMHPMFAKFVALIKEFESVIYFENPNDSAYTLSGVERVCKLLNLEIKRDCAVPYISIRNLLNDTPMKDNKDLILQEIKHVANHFMYINLDYHPRLNTEILSYLMSELKHTYDKEVYIEAVLPTTATQAEMDEVEKFYTRPVVTSVTVTKY